jgi:hypothetical protein
MHPQTGARRESLGTDSLLSARFLVRASPIEPTGGKFFCAPHGGIATRFIASSPRAMTPSPHGAPSWRDCAIITEVPAAQLFLR